MNSMKIIHELEKYNQKIKKSGEGSSFLFTNKQESFAWVGTKPESRYQGIFFSIDGKMFRVLESIQPKETAEELANKFWCGERKSKLSREIFFMPDEMKCFSYESDSETEVCLDFCEAYSHDYAIYDVEQIEQGLIVYVTYRGELYFIVIRFEGKSDVKGKWQVRQYSYDAQRNSRPFDRNVFFLGTIDARKIVFSASKNKDEALQESEKVFGHLERYKHEKKNRVEKIFKLIDSGRIELDYEKVNCAYNSSRLLLDNLSSKQGLFAGLPWFFQYWSRDELISLRALYDFDVHASRKIFEKWIRSLKLGWTRFPAKYKPDGSPEGLSIDAAGWLMKRFELFRELEKTHEGELELFFFGLNPELMDIRTNSWMDSIERPAPLEIQAMRLYALNEAHRITKKERFKEIEKILKGNVLRNYFDGKLLYDSGDKKVRPNIFIAYHFYPDLLDKKEWEKVFDNELKELWLDWGGLSTISQKDDLFHPDYTGEIPGSYHNGDSWFWINNLAALVLFGLNHEKYSKYIKKIVEASTQEILWMGAIGNHAELSSASALNSEGCPAQAFSAAMFVELIDAIAGKK